MTEFVLNGRHATKQRTSSSSYERPKRGVKFAYFDAVHVIYKVHDANSSAAGGASNLERQSRVLRLLAEGYERELARGDWTSAERRALRRLGKEWFWTIGYASLWQNGRTSEALAAFRTGIRAWPWTRRCWKTYLLAVCKSARVSKVRSEREQRLRVAYGVSDRPSTCVLVAEVASAFLVSDDWQACHGLGLISDRRSDRFIASPGHRILKGVGAESGCLDLLAVT